MSIEIIKGPVPRAQKVCVYGPEGVGKTTFAGKFPRPLFVDLEKGSCAYNVHRVHPETVIEVEKILDLILAGGSGYQTVVFDSYDALWHLYAAHVARLKGVTCVEDLAFGAGVKMVADLLTQLLRGRVERVVDSGVNVVVVAHTESRAYHDTQHGVSYDRYQFRVQRLSAYILMQQMDSVLFVNFDTKLVQEADGKYRAVGGKERVLTTIRTPAADGKSRFALPDKVGLTETTVLKLLGNGNVRLRHEWDDILKGFSDEQIAGFLVKSGSLEEGQKWWEVRQEVVNRGVVHAEKLRAAVEGYVATLQKTAA